MDKSDDRQIVNLRSAWLVPIKARKSALVTLRGKDDSVSNPSEKDSRVVDATHLISSKTSSLILTLWGVGGVVLESDDRPHILSEVRLFSVLIGCKN